MAWLNPGALCFVAGVTFGICCSRTDRAEPEPETTPETEAEQTATSEPNAHRTFYALGAHLDRAELRQAETRVIDFGTPASHQYTLGGWRTRVGDDHDFDGVSATLVEGVTAEFLLPSERIGAAKLTLRARTFGRDGRATFYINEDSVHHVRFPADGTFGVVTVELPAGALVLGENTLQVRVPARGRDAGVHAGMAIDWLRLGPPDDVATAPPDVRRELPAGWSLSWTFEAPVGAALEAPGPLTARVFRDGAEPLSLGSLAEEVELGAGLLRLELTATADTPVSAVQVVVPDERETRTAIPGSAARGNTPVRNVIVWLVDTVRADKLRPWNEDTRVQTPGLERWVRSATVFDQGRTQENWTKPSVATLLSGLLPWQHTATSGEAVLPRSVEMLSETLHAQGFATAGFVCNGYVSRTFGFHQGWDAWRNYIREGRRTAARFVAADVLEWLDARDTTKPFFLYVHTIDPHVPYIPPDETLALYDEEPYEGPVDFTRDRQLLEKIKAGRLRLNDRDKQRLEALYDGEITYHDSHFASVIEGLERRGLADETMVVFTADHGEELFDHDSVGHGHSLFEELLHVPLVMSVPGVTTARVEEPVGLVDIMPTVLDALGESPRAEMTGRSVLPLMRGQKDDAPRPSIAGFLNGWRSLSVGRYKLIQRTHRRWMLFDLQADPTEHNDIAARHPLAVRYLRGLLGVVMQGEARHQSEQTEIDAETEAQLRALGYVGGQPR